MTSYIWLLMLGMATNFVTILILFLPPADKIFDNHPECSIASFSPDLNSKQKAFCREWSKK